MEGRRNWVEAGGKETRVKERTKEGEGKGKMRNVGGKGKEEDDEGRKGRN